MTAASVHHHSRKSNARARSTVSVDPDALAIERKRAKLKSLSVAKLCRVADISASTFARNLKGESRMSRVTRKRLLNALEGIQVAKKPAPAVLLALHRSFMAAIAALEGMDPAKVLATDFEKQRPENPDWLAASRIRALATDLCVCELSIVGAELSRAIGCTKMSVIKQIRRAGDMRDDPATEARLDQVARLLTGRA